MGMLDNIISNFSSANPSSSIQTGNLGNTTNNSAPSTDSFLPKTDGGGIQAIIDSVMEKTNKLIQSFLGGGDTSSANTKNNGFDLSSATDFSGGFDINKFLSAFNNNSGNVDNSFLGSSNNNNSAINSNNTNEIFKGSNQNLNSASLPFESLPDNGNGSDKSKYSEGTNKYILDKEKIQSRYYEGGKANNADFYGNSTNVKSSLVASDMVKSIKENWKDVDPEVRKIFESEHVDKFFGAHADKVKNLEPWQKAAIFQLGKASFETSGTFDPNHKDPGGQAWGNLSLYNKDASFKDYGLKTKDLQSKEAEEAMTSPGFAAIADLDTIDESLNLKQDGNKFGNDSLLDKAHFMFVDVNKGEGEYERQKSSFLDAVFNGSNNIRSNLDCNNIVEFVMRHGDDTTSGTAAA